MTTLENRPNTALLVIDVQNGVVGEAYDRDAVIANIATLIDRARAADVDVVWVQHNDDDLKKDSESWQYVPELVRHDVGALDPEGVRRRVRRRPIWSRSSPRAASADSSSRARRPTRVSDRHFTVRSRAATMPRSSATHTQRKTSHRGARRRPTRSSPTRTCTGSTRRLPGAAAAPSTRPTWISPQTRAPKRLG